MLLHPLRSYTGLLVPLLVGACDATKIDYTVAHVRVHPPSSALCAPPSQIEEIAVQALGDFPASDQTIELLRPGVALATVDRFPVGTSALSFEARTGSGWRAGAVRETVGREDILDALLLPYARSCAVGDPELRAPPASSVAALSDGGLLILGGSEGGLASRRLVWLPPGRELSVIVGDGIQLRREGATATESGDWIVVAGGAAGATGVAHDTFEVLRRESDGIAIEGLHPLCPTSASTCTGRRNHGAGRLPDGRVLLVGGVAETGSAPLDSAEIVDPESGDVDVEIGPLPLAREWPQVVTLDDGTVLVVGGRGTGGGFTGTVFWLDTEARELVQIGEGNVLAPREGAVAVPLVGARVAWIYSTGGAAGTGLSIQLFLRSGSYLPGAPSFRLVEMDFAGRVPGLDGLQAAALPDGRLLVTGRDAEPRARAFVIDVGTDDVRESEASRIPTALVALTDGTTAELDAGGASLRREALLSPLDNPQATLLAGSAAGVAFDAAAGWLPVGADFHARVEGARLDVPTLVFADFTAELEAEGDAELLLLAPGREPAAIVMREGSVGPALCETTRVDGAPLHVSRTGSKVEVSAGGASRTCTIPALPDHVGLAVRASNGTFVRALRITRL